MVSMGKYYWRKKYKVVVKIGAKRTREGSTKQMPALSQVIWKLDTPDSKQGELDTTAVIGDFAGANYDYVLELSVNLTDKEQELQKDKMDLEAVRKNMKQEMK